MVMSVEQLKEMSHELDRRMNEDKFSFNLVFNPFRPGFNQPPLNFPLLVKLKDNIEIPSHFACALLDSRDPEHKNVRWYWWDDAPADPVEGIVTHWAQIPTVLSGDF